MMTFLDWMNMNMVVDISCVVLLSAMVWKLRKMEKKIAILQQNVELVARNPRIARRQLKK